MMFADMLQLSIFLNHQLQHLWCLFFYLKTSISFFTIIQIIPNIYKPTIVIRSYNFITMIQIIIIMCNTIIFLYRNLATRIVSNFSYLTHISSQFENHNGVTLTLFIYLHYLHMCLFNALNQCILVNVYVPFYYFFPRTRDMTFYNLRCTFFLKFTVKLLFLQMSRNF